jgi:vacuolar-type H+-ATPase subunit F/Vma7
MSNSFWFHVRQILADKLIKSCSFFRVKWIGINKQGCTWEPRDNIIVEKADTILKVYLVKKEAQLVATEKRKHDALAIILVETGMAETEKKETDNNQPSSTPLIKVEATRNRVNESPCSASSLREMVLGQDRHSNCQASSFPTMPTS